MLIALEMRLKNISIAVLVSGKTLFKLYIDTLLDLIDIFNKAGA